MAYEGKSIVVYRDGIVIACTTSDEFSAGCDVIETSSPSCGQYKTYIVGRKRWSVTTNFLVSSLCDISSLLSVGTLYTLRINNRKSLNYVTGMAILSQCRIVSTSGNLVKGVFTFEGTGPLESTNLLTITRGWEQNGGADATYNAERLMVRGASGDVYAPKVWLQRGTTVCFSVDQMNSIEIAFCVSPSLYDRLDLYYERGSVVTYWSQTRTVVGATRTYASFTMPEDAYLVVNPQTGNWLQRPQLEKGNVPTVFVNPGL